jgi:hypothetical protein
MNKDDTLYSRRQLACVWLVVVAAMGYDLLPQYDVGFFALGLAAAIASIRFLHLRYRSRDVSLEPATTRIDASLRLATGTSFVDQGWATAAVVIVTTGTLCLSSLPGRAGDLVVEPFTDPGDAAGVTETRNVGYVEANAYGTGTSS